MIKENKVSKYVLYAIGEIVLVVIGILIALSINDWNQDKKNIADGILILKNLKADLNEDLRIINSTIRFLNDRQQRSNNLLILLTSPVNNSTLDSADVVSSLIRTGFIFKFAPTFAAYNEIQNSGKLNLIKSEAIKKELAGYRSQVQENISIENPYNTTLKEFERKVINFLSEIPDTDNYIQKRPTQYTKIKFNLEEMSLDKKFIELLKHISYHTKVEIGLKENLIKPRIERLLKLINSELE